MSKIACCISGQPRNIKKGFEFIYENILKPNDPDVFIHVWWTPEQAGLPVINSKGNIASSPLEPDTPDIIRSLYNPRNLIVERQILFDRKDYNKRKLPEIKPFNSISQKYSIMRANDLKAVEEMAGNFTYDWVIRARFDWAIKEPLDLSKYENDKIYLPDNCTYAGGVNDQFAFGPSHLMDIYSGLYYELDLYYRGYGVTFCDELFLGKHLELKKIPFQPIKISYELLRK